MAEKKKTKKKTSSKKTTTIESSGKVTEKLLDENLKGSGLDALAKILSGEMALRNKEEEIKKLKKEAIEKQKERTKAKISKGELILEKEDSEFATEPEKKVVQKLTLFKWKAPIRITFSYDSKVFRAVLILSLLFILYLALLGHYGLMFSIIALLFFIYVSGTTEPIDIEHLITTRGIESFDKLYEWYMLEDFWFSKKNDQYVLLVETKLRAPTKLMLLVNKSDVTAIFLLLQDKLLYKDIKKYSKVDGWAYGEYLPIEDV